MMGAAAGSMLVSAAVPSGNKIVSLTRDKFKLVKDTTRRKRYALSPSGGEN